MNTNVMDEVEKVGPILIRNRKESLKNVTKRRVVSDIERVIKNHSMSQTAVCKLIGVHRDTLKAKVDELVSSGKMDPIVTANNSNVYTLSHIHILLDEFEVPKAPPLEEPEVIDVDGQKGGTGKSSWLVATAVAQALNLADRRRTLIIEIDPQGSDQMALCPLNIYDKNKLTAVDIMMGDDEPHGLYAKKRKSGLTHEEIVLSAPLKTHIPNLDLLPASTDDERYSMYAFKVFLEAKTPEEGSKILRQLRERLIDVYAGHYDYIYIDTGPQINPLVWNAQEACTGMVIPVTPHSMDWGSTVGFINNLPSQVKQLPSQGKNIKWWKVAITNYTDLQDDAIVSEMQTGLKSLMFSNRNTHSPAFEAAASSFCTVHDLIKAEVTSDGSCKPRELDQAQESSRAVATEVTGVINMHIDSEVA